MRKRNHRMNRETRALIQRGEIRTLISPARLAERNQLHTDADVTRRMNVVRAALVRMLESTASQQDYLCLGGEINTCWIAAADIEGGELVQKPLEAAGDALLEANRIHQQHGRYGLTGPGRVALGQGVDAIELVYRATSPVQMDRAEKALDKARQQLQP